MNLEATETLARLQMHRRELAILSQKYSEFLDATSNGSNLVLVLLFSGLSCLIIAIVIWLAPLVDGRQLTGMVVISLVLGGISLFAFAFRQYQIEEHKRLLRIQLKAQLAAARELDETLRDKEQKLAVALENDLKAGSSDAR